MKTFILLLLCALASSAAAEGSCRASRRCCDGKDGDCVATNSGSGDDEYDYDDECYCDHGCLDVGDCCSDFKDYCGVIDCEVGDWSSWSECDVSCGEGTSVRSREVIRPESNGGTQCPPLQEKRTCRESKCKNRDLDKVPADKETALLLPSKYALQQRNTRQYDVRSNLRSFRKKESRFQYCAVFHVDKAMRSCGKNEETRELRRGHTVCVLCDGKALQEDLGGRCKGHGSEERATRFKNLVNPRCHGKWTRLQISEGECPCRGGPDFVFV